MANELIFSLVLLFLTSCHHLVASQNLSKYHGKHCDFNAVKRDSHQHIAECNTDMEPVSEKYVYIPLLCVEWTCQCPNTYSIKGKELNATGYEWKEEKAQCLLSEDSDCRDLARNLCASGYCIGGKCVNATSSNRNGGNKCYNLFPMFPLAILIYMLASLFVNSMDF